MIRNVVFAVCAALGLTAFAGTAPAQFPGTVPFQPQPSFQPVPSFAPPYRPQPFPHHPDCDDSVWQVWVRHHGHWDLEGSFRSADRAYHVARHFEHEGHYAQVRRVCR